MVEDVKMVNYYRSCRDVLAAGIFCFLTWVVITWVYGNFLYDLCTLLYPFYFILIIIIIIIFKFIYFIFIFGCVGSSFLCKGFL